MDKWVDHQLEPKIHFTKAHAKAIEALTFNPVSHNQLASGGHDFLIKLWDIEKCKENMTLAKHTAGIWALDYSADGQQLFSGSPDKSIIAWDVKSGKEIATLNEHTNSIYTIAASDNGNYLMSGGQDGHLILWDIRKLQIIKDLKSSMDIIYHIHITKGSKYFFTSDSLGIIKAYDGDSFVELAATKLQQKKEKLYTIESFEMENNYKLLVGQKNKCVSEYTFDVGNQTLHKDHEAQAHFDGVQCLNIDKKAERFVTGARDGSARLWNIKRETDDYQAIATLIGHKEKVTGIEFHHNQELVATGSWDENIHIYKI